VLGLSRSSQLKVSSSGVLEGLVTEADVALEATGLRVVALDHGRHMLADYVLPVDVEEIPANSPPRALDKLALQKLNKSLLFNSDGNIVVYSRQGISFRLDLKTAFEDEDSDDLIFSLSGFPVGSGISIDKKTGVLSGIPTRADRAAAVASDTKSLILTIVAKDSFSSEDDFPSLDVEVHVGEGKSAVQSNSDSNSSNRQTAASPAFLAKERDIQQSAVVVTAGSKFVSDIERVFLLDYRQNGHSEPLVKYSIKGLPSRSGIRLDPDTGMLLGIPGPSDIAARQPLFLTVKTVPTQFGSLPTLEKFFSLVVLSFAANPVASSLTPVTFTIGQRISFNPVLLRGQANRQNRRLRRLFSSEIPTNGHRTLRTQEEIAQMLANQVQPRRGTSEEATVTAQRRFFQVGLPFGSGLSVDSTNGVLSGIPNERDLELFSQKEAPNVVSIVVTNDDRQAMSTVLVASLSITVNSKSAPHSADLDLNLATRENTYP